MGASKGGIIIRNVWRSVSAALAVAPTFVCAQGMGLEAEPATSQLSARQMFDLAERARQAGDFTTAEAVYRALQSDPDLELRAESCFRLGMMLADDLRRYTDAAIEFRRILDDKPTAARVRLELARVLSLSGNRSGAERQLRAAEAAGLPPDVERLVRFYANALNAQKPFGGSLEVALAPDTNVNRATRSDTLGTVIGNFTLAEDARAKSGVGLSLRGQTYWRKGLQQGVDLLTRVSGNATLYRHPDFNDISTGLQLGPQYTSGQDRITLALGPTWRWYGKQFYSLSYGATASWQHPTGKRSQLQLDGGISHVENKRNVLQTSDVFTASASLDRAFSAKFGGGLQVFGWREAARDPGYSLASGGVSAYAFREVGRTTFVASAGYSYLEADARLFLYLEPRVDDRYSASIAAKLRTFRVGTVAPLVRVKWERNSSTIEIYDYKRISAEFGLSSAF